MSEIQQPVFRREGDPYIYLYVKEVKEWYCYDPLNSLVGSGAMGTVYSGFRCKTHERVAIKKVNDRFSNIKMIRERARQEASLVFRHPNLVEMIGLCEENPNRGSIYIISKFVNGQNIDVYVKNSLNSALDRVEKICHLIYPVLDALSYIHSRGVVHRDIKPCNIMVENNMNVRLMDLGIARMNGGNQFSMMGFIGTPEYSAPEQISRSVDNPVQINAATDIYSLGITLYELLTGSNPMVGQADVDTLTNQMKEKLPGSNKIPSRLMRVLWKATEKEQEKRYQSAAEFRNAIIQALLPEPSLSQKVFDWIDSNSFLSIGILAVLIAVVFLIIFL